MQPCHAALGQTPWHGQNPTAHQSGASGVSGTSKIWSLSGLLWARARYWPKKETSRQRNDHRKAGWVAGDAVASVTIFLRGSLLMLGAMIGGPASAFFFWPPGPRVPRLPMFACLCCTELGRASPALAFSHPNDPNRLTYSAYLLGEALPEVPLHCGHTPNGARIFQAPLCQAPASSSHQQIKGVAMQGLRAAAACN